MHFETLISIRNFAIMVYRFLLRIVVVCCFVPVQGQIDASLREDSTYVSIRKHEIDSLLALQSNQLLTPDFYKERYRETNLLHKVTDNKGDGFDSLYGTRNLRPILHGVAYRGGANNFYHKERKRHNHNPLPDDGIRNLCQEGFGASVYLYRQNFETAPTIDTCACISGGSNTMDYYQYDYNDQAHIYEALKLIYLSATSDTIGPIYLHCWNGWHASGLLSALALRQFCGYDKWEAINYWDLGTDGANNSPRYQVIREMIKSFEPYPDLTITDELGNKICPPMPESIDENELYVDIEQLIYVPESMPVGFSIVLHNINFDAGRTYFANPKENKDIINLVKALQTHSDIKVELGGYTDNTGSRSTNVELATKRAKFVYDALIQQGIDANRLSYKGYGPQKPLYSNRYSATREGNRRIEVKITDKKEEDFSKLIEERTTTELSVELDELQVFTIGDLFERLSSVPLNHGVLVPSLVYEPNEVAVPESAKGELDKLATWLTKNKSISIRIDAHTDRSGLEELNVTLSEQRAEGVFNYLIAKGVNERQLNFQGLGSSNPIASNKYQYGKEINRRIEVVLISTGE